MTVSDSSGVLVFDHGMTEEDWHIIVECKNIQRGRLSSIADRVSGTYHAGKSPWDMEVKYDLALPCATQNEINHESAERLVRNGVCGVLEGANLPTNIGAQEYFRSHFILYVPGKASNAGGVGVSGLEMSQNAQRLTWKPEEVDQKLQDMMESIYNLMAKEEKSGGTLEQGANRAGFIKIAMAMKELGWVY